MFLYVMLQRVAIHYRWMDGWMDNSLLSDLSTTVSNMPKLDPVIDPAFLIISHSLLLSPVRMLLPQQRT